MWEKKAYHGRRRGEWKGRKREGGREAKEGLDEASRGPQGATTVARVTMAARGGKGQNNNKKGKQVEYEKPYLKRHLQYWHPCTLTSVCTCTMHPSCRNTRNKGPEGKRKEGKGKEKLGKNFKI